MNCRSAEGLYSSFLEEELSQRERRALESHLAECRRCSMAVEELRETVDLLGALPAYETSPHFEEEVMDRIRSGEALRPTMIEWIQELLTPARLRPVFLAGAGACAVWIAVIVGGPIGKQAIVAHRASPSITAETPMGVEATNGSGAGSTLASGSPTSPAQAPATETLAIGPRPAESAPSARSERSPSLTEARTAPDAGASALARDSSTPAATAPYQDEYILDQFYLNRSSEDGPSQIVPVTGRPSDDVYIIF